MFSKILTFSVLSVFCVLTAISSVYAHDVSSPTYDGDLYHEHGSGWHYHRNVVDWESGELTDPGHPEIHHNTAVPGLTTTPARAPAGTGKTINHPHLKDGFANAHANSHDTSATGYEAAPDPDPTPDPVENTNEWHWHTFTAHRHDDYASHTHRVGHKHSSITNPHPHPNPHYLDNDHSNVGTRMVEGTVVQSAGLILQSSPQVNAPLGGIQRPANQQPVNQQPVNQQPVNQQPVNQPTVTQPTTVVTGGTPAGTSSPQPVGPIAAGIAPQERRPSAPLMQPIRVTEYMVRDWSAGSSGLPQWIEVYNPNTEAVNLKGWTFQYATRRSANAPHKVHTLTLAGTQDGFSIAGGGVAILSTGTVSAWRFSGIEATQVYNLNIDNVLKRGWVLTDADGAEIHRLGRAAFGALGDPVAPLHQNQARVSHQVVPSESPPEVYYYGHREDMGSPGFYEQPAPSAPSAVKRKRVGTWASLKQTP